MGTGRYRTLQEFYPFYLSQHQNRICRRLHFAGTSIAIVLILYALASGRYGFLLLALVQGYAWAWVGHFFFEHNRPATFTYPLLSFMGDWKLWLDMLTGRVRW